MSRSDYYTSLTLDRFARVMGINPLSFNGAWLTGIDNPMAVSGNQCSDIWFQYSWQSHDQVSRDDLAREIDVSEEQIRDFIGYHFTPTWITEEIHEYSPHNLEHYYGTTGINSMGGMQSIRLDNAFCTEVGQRKVTLLATPSVAALTMVFSDPDGDTFKELCTLTVNIGTATIDKKTVKLFTTGKDGMDTWEIRYPKTINIVGAVMTITVDSWLLIDPDLWDEYPLADGTRSINITPNTEFVASVEVYTEKADRTLPAVVFYWEDEGVITTQNGWLNISGQKKEFAVPYPATYDATTDKWIAECFTYGTAPNYFKVYYRAGTTSRDFVSGKSYDPLDSSWAQVIAWLTTPRLEREFCQCGNITALIQDLHTDLSLSGSGSGTFFMPIEQLSNPFGTRRGEMMAWKRLAKYGIRSRSGGGVAI